MSAKRKNQQTISGRADAELTKRQHELDRARKAHAQGKMCMEDYIWTAMQIRYFSKTA